MAPGGLAMETWRVAGTVLVLVFVAALAGCKENPAQGPAAPAAAAPSAPDVPQAAPAAVRRVHIFVSGQVQGVGFRAFVQGHAAALGLSGFVRNLEDGRVEAVIQGPPEQVGALVDLVKRGPPSAQVEGLDVKDEPPASDADGFSIRR
jgi:acylphosphatase